MSCGRSFSKEVLRRFVRDPDGRVRADPDGRVQARGAYLCRDERCRREVVDGRGFSRSFRARVTVGENDLD